MRLYRSDIYIGLFLFAIFVVIVAALAQDAHNEANPDSPKNRCIAHEGYWVNTGKYGDDFCIRRDVVIDLGGSQ